MKIIKMFLRYGIMKRFKGGIKLCLVLTFKCNLKCPYCTVDIPIGERPDIKEKSIDEWKNFIKTFPLKIREFRITGGSPEMYPYFSELINWLLDQGYFVMVYTNLLHLNKLQQLRKTYRLFLGSTYHHCSSQKQFDKNYQILKQDYRITVEEIKDHISKCLPYSKLKNIIVDKDEMKENKEIIRVRPDLTMVTNCYEISNYK